MVFCGRGGRWRPAPHRSTSLVTRALGIGFPVGYRAHQRDRLIFHGCSHGLARLPGRVRDGRKTCRLFAATGVLGGYTTFSSLLAWTPRCSGNACDQPLQAALYVLGSVGVSLVAIFAGLSRSFAFACHEHGPQTRRHGRRERPAPRPLVQTELPRRSRCRTSTRSCERARCASTASASTPQRDSKRAQRSACRRSSLTATVTKPARATAAPGDAEGPARHDAV